MNRDLLVMSGSEREQYAQWCEDLSMKAGGMMRRHLLACARFARGEEGMPRDA